MNNDFAKLEKQAREMAARSIDDYAPVWMCLRAALAEIDRLRSEMAAAKARETVAGGGGMA